ncbi:MAG: phosphoribosylglycinamide formyltransferase [Leptospiraceae bacterium]|nr:phosphoribosylglycinamide formyltransferase [Leptospiraceae bacterium]
MNKKIVVLASGNGTNFSALFRYLKRKKLPAEIVSLISDNPESNALLIALAHGVPSHTIDFKRKVKEEANSELHQRLKELEPDLIVTAGYMRILPEPIIASFPNKIINIHPSLLPAFKGLKAIAQAKNYGVKVTGCTTHFVDASIDGGYIILQEVLKIKPNMTEDDIHSAVQKLEHKILPKSVHLFLTGKLSIQDRTVIIEEIS